MTSASATRRIANELLSLHPGDDAVDARRRAVASLHALAQADLTLFFDARRRNDAPSYDALLAHGTGFEAVPTLYHGRPILSGPSLDIGAPQRSETTHFRQVLIDDTFRGSMVDRDFTSPLGLRSCLRLLVYDGDEFAGYIGVYRCRDTRPFGRDERRALQPLVRPITSLLAAAHRVSRGHLRDGDLVLSATGRLLYATESLLGWLTQARRERLAHHVRHLERGEHGHCVAMLGPSEVRFTRLEGDGATAWLARVVELEPFRCSPLARLTPRQREVADYAAAGATTAEIGRALGVSTETAREHLANVYDRLGVASRVELCQALNTDSP